VITKSVICSARQHYTHIALCAYAIARRRLSVCLSVPLGGSLKNG